MLKQLLRTKHPLAVNQEAGEIQLRRTLGPWGLTAIGIGAVIGGGIFVMTGHAAAEHAGPAIILSFLIAASVARSALCVTRNSLRWCPYRGAPTHTPMQRSAKALRGLLAGC